MKEITKLLLEKGADPKQPDANDTLPLNITLQGTNRDSQLEIKAIIKSRITQMRKDTFTNTSLRTLFR